MARRSALDPAITGRLYDEPVYGLRDSISGGGPVATVAVIGFVVSILAAGGVSADAADERSAEFMAASERAALVVQDRVDAVIGVHEVMRDAVGAAWPLDRVEFHDIVASEQGANPFADVQAVSFNRWVDNEDVAAFERQVTLDSSLNGVGYPDFAVAPTTTEFDDRIVVEYIEPLAGNEAAFGFDIGSNPARRAAVAEARDSGRLVATEPITLVQEVGEQRGFLLISPVYDTTAALVSGPSRRRHFVGVVVTVVRTGDLFEGALTADPLVDLEIYDLGRTVDAGEPEFDPDTLVFNERGDRFVGSDGAVEGESFAVDVDVGSRRWRLVSRLAAPAASVPLAAIAVAGAGLAITAAIAFALWTAARARQRAEDLADERTADLQALVASAPDATLVVDANGVIVLASDQVRRLLGHEPDDLIGRPVEDLVPDEVRAGHEQHRGDFMRSPERRSMGAGLELDARRADGSTVPVEISLSPLTGETFGAVVASLRDVTVQRQARRDLELANDMKTAFLATVSHELRTPLTAIGGFAQLLLRDRPSGLGPDQTHLVERIVDNSLHLNQLVEDLIAFTRLDTDASSLDPLSYGARDLVQGALDALGPVLDGRPVHLQGPNNSVFVDAHAFRRMFSNLLVNAHRYSPPESPIRISIGGDGGTTTEVHVDDHGPGVPVDEREHVFERFWRGDLARQRSVSGTGVGLAVVASLAGASRGTVSVTDASSGGARFTLRLPSVAGVGLERDEPEHTNP